MLLICNRDYLVHNSTIGWQSFVSVTNAVTSLRHWVLSVRCKRCRIEKEKSQMKAESDDLRAQIEHIGKTKVEELS